MYSRYNRKNTSDKMLKDNILTFKTPEGIHINLHLSGCSTRAAAFFIDLAIRIAIYIAFTMASNFIPSMLKMGVLFIFIFLLEWFYFILFEMYRNGQTPGKQYMKIRVVSSTGTSLTWGQSITRNLIRAVDMIPFCYGFAIISSFIDPYFRRLGDLAAGTVVVYTDIRKKKNPLKIFEVKAEPLPVPLHREEEKAIVNFAYRHGTFSKEREIELAEILTPLHHEKSTKALDKTLGYGLYLNGESND